MLDEKILGVLRNNRETYVSSEELCKISGVSRAAVWKHMEILRAEGYAIEASPHLGYKLIKAPDRLIPSELKHNLRTKALGREVISYKKVDSTNDVAYSLAEGGIKEGVIITAEEQARGKGRLGRRWISPSKGGIYMSCVLRPDISPREIPKITLLAAVAVAQSIREAVGVEAMIKWPNDIVVGGRKVCGILTEMKAEQDRVDFVVLGIGVNVATAPDRLPKGASSLKEELARIGRDEEISRVELAKGIIESLEESYNILRKEGFGPIIESWKGLSMMLGSRIRVVLPNRTFEGLAHDLDPEGSLIVRLDSGVHEKVSSGDVVMIR